MDFNHRSSVARRYAANSTTQNKTKQKRPQPQFPVHLTPPSLVDIVYRSTCLQKYLSTEVLVYRSTCLQKYLSTEVLVYRSTCLGGLYVDNVPIKENYRSLLQNTNIYRRLGRIVYRRNCLGGLYGDNVPPYKRELQVSFAEYQYLQKMGMSGRFG